MRRLLVGLAVVALTSCSAATEPPSSTTPDPAPTYTTAPASELVAKREIKPDPTTPTHFRLGAIDAPVIPLELTGSELVPPSDPTVLGWWGRPAGSAHGVTLLVGHTVHDGGGELDNLEDVPVRAVANLDGLRYVVTSNRVISKGELAAEAQRLFDQSGPHRLVVVTCEDYDPETGHYASNVVLTAVRS